MPRFERLEDTSRFYLMLHPRPLALIVARCPGGRVNAMPASWITPVSEEPPLVAVAVYKQNYTIECLEYSLEATLNIPRAEHADIVYKAGSVSGRETDKVSQLKLSLEDSPSVSAPHWADALGYMEVRVRDSVDAGESRLYLLEVIAAHVRSELWSRWGWRLPQADLILHGSGRAFYKVGSLVLSKS